MPYYITKEDFINNFINIFNTVDSQILNVIKADLISEKPCLLKDEFFLQIETCKLSLSAIETLSNMLFQLKNNKYYLTYFLNLLLKSNQFESVCYFITKIFVGHIGDSHYVTVKEGEVFNYAERYFDRLIEAFIYTNINFDEILPFIMAINESKKDSIMHTFLRPSLEFLKSYILKKEITYLNFIHCKKYFYIGNKLNILLFGKKALNNLINNYIANKYFDEAEVIKLIEENKTLALPLIKDFLLNVENDDKYNLLKLYLAFPDDVRQTLPELTEVMLDESLKMRINEELKESLQQKFKNIESFIKFANQTSQISHDDADITFYLNNGEKASVAVVSFIINSFKDIKSPFSLKKLLYLKEFISAKELNTLCNNLIEKYLIAGVNKKNDWVVALVSTLGLSDSIEAVCNKISISRETDVEFSIECLIENNCKEINNYIKEKFKETSNSKYKKYLKMMANANKLDFEDYLDEMVNNFNFNEDCERVLICNGEQVKLTIGDYLTVELIELKTNKILKLENIYNDENNVKELIFLLQKEIAAQVERLKVAYLKNRKWEPSVFVSNFLNNPFLKKIADTLMFAVYKNGKVHQVANSLEKLREYAANTILDNDNYKIGLVSLCELKDYEELSIVNKYQPFKQINSLVFKVSDINDCVCTVFRGVITENNFIKKLKLNGWDLIESYCCKNFKECGVTVKLSYENESGEVKVNNIEFFDTVNLKKWEDVLPENLLTLGNINRRTYNYILNEIYNILSL